MKQNPFTAKAKKSKLKPFGSTSGKTLPGTQTARSTGVKVASTSKSKTTKPVRLGRAQQNRLRPSPEMHGRLTYLFSLGFLVGKYRGDWVIKDRFSNVQPEYGAFDDYREALNLAKKLNDQVQERRIKALEEFDHAVA